MEPCDAPLLTSLRTAHQAVSHHVEVLASRSGSGTARNSRAPGTVLEADGPVPLVMGGDQVHSAAR